MSYPATVKIVEVGPRDGLQNEPKPVDVSVKVALIERLADAGVPYIEAGSFVSPKWVPQMAGSEQVFSSIKRKASTTYAALTPNLAGFERAISVNASEIAIFAAASESFSQKNINCSIAESIARFAPVMTAAKEKGIAVRGYVSRVFGCPYDGATAPASVLDVSQQLLELGCYEISLGDTIGVGTPGSVEKLLATLIENIPPHKLAVHFHDTYGQALANILLALQHGITVIDSSVAGLGGCPYAQGASGNVASEDVVYMLRGLGIKTGIDLHKLVAAGNYISAQLGRDNQSRVARAMSGKNEAQKANP
ncbi:MAG: hydroxymethylglutaryl-CoA lyase [Pseudomonadales bacterium]